MPGNWQFVVDTWEKTPVQQNTYKHSTTGAGVTSKAPPDSGAKNGRISKGDFLPRGCWTSFVKPSICHWSKNLPRYNMCYSLEKKISLFEKNIPIQSQVEKMFVLTYCCEIHDHFPSKRCSNWFFARKIHKIHRPYFWECLEQYTKEDLLLSFGYGSFYSQCHPAGCHRGRYSVRMTQEILEIAKYWTEPLNKTFKIASGRQLFVSHRIHGTGIFVYIYCIISHIIYKMYR